MAWIVVAVCFIIHIAYMANRPRGEFKFTGFIQLNAWVFFLALIVGVFGLFT